jgi:mRNA interferase MazF
MNQGDIYEIFFDPTLGSEQRGRRPAIILSGSGINKILNTVIVVPLTSKLKNYNDNLILEPNVKNGLKKVSEALPIHIRAIDKTRLKNKVGSIEPFEINILKKSLDKILKY